MTSKRPPGRTAPKPPPRGKVVVPIAMLVCAAIAMALYASFPNHPRPALAQPSPFRDATPPSEDASSVLAPKPAEDEK